MHSMNHKFNEIKKLFIGMLPRQIIGVTINFFFFFSYIGIKVQL
jgi:hypothetical protein